GSAASLYFGVQAQKQAEAEKVARRVSERKSYCLGMMQAYEEYEKGQIKRAREILHALDGDQHSARGFESYYLERLCRLDLFTILTDSHANAVAFEPSNGRWLATADDRGIHIWETATGKELRAIYGHRGTVRDLAVSPDGRLLASAGIDNSAKCWD